MPQIWWPALVVGLILGLYWGRVIRLVQKAKGRGESAHFFPPETVGRIIRAIWYPTVAVWIAAPLMLAFRRHGEWWLTPTFYNTVIQYAATIVCAVLLYATMVCWRRMGREWRMGIDPNEKNNLLVSGPYAYVRHPIYSLQQALAIASAVAVPVPLMFLVALLEVILLSWEAIREEQHLTTVHGEVYRNYMRSTGRFIPRLLKTAH